MYATDFEFRNERLSDYGMILCTFDSNTNGSVSSGCDLTFNTVRPIGSNKLKHYSSTYEDAYSTQLSICKDPSTVSYSEEQYLTPDEVSKLQRWLCQKNGYYEFKVDQDGYRDIYWNVMFTSQQHMINGRIGGLDLTLTADANFGYSDDVEIEFNIGKGDSFELYDRSDEIGAIRVDMTITILEDGNFILNNSMEDESKATVINNCVTGEVITIDGENQIITSSTTSHTLLPTDFNYHYPIMVNTYDNKSNILRSSLDCKIKLSYSPIRKVGL